MLFSSFFLLTLASSISAIPYDDKVSSTETTEFGSYVNPSPKNICQGEELETLTACASEVLRKLDECKPDDLACECCSLQSMKRDCYGLCPNTASGNFLAVLYDDCETMNDINACSLPFKKHDAHIAKFLRPNSRVPVEVKEPDFFIKSVLENATSNEENANVISFLDHQIGLKEFLNENEIEEASGSLHNTTRANTGSSSGNSTNSTGVQEANAGSTNTQSAFFVSILAATVALTFL